MNVQGDNVAGTICRVIDCRRHRLSESFYCTDHLPMAWALVPLPLKARITRKGKSDYVSDRPADYDPGDH